MSGGYSCSIACGGYDAGRDERGGAGEGGYDESRGGERLRVLSELRPCASIVP